VIVLGSHGQRRAAPQGKEEIIMNKITKATPRERSSPQNGMPEPVRYVYRQQKRRNDWAARIARRNAEGWLPPPAVSVP